MNVSLAGDATIGLPLPTKVVNVDPLAGLSTNAPEFTVTLTEALPPKESVIVMAAFIVAFTGVTVQFTGVDDNAVPDGQPVTVMTDVSYVSVEIDPPQGLVTVKL